jgi:hypothetical protein
MAGVVDSKAAAVRRATSGAAGELAVQAWLVSHKYDVALADGLIHSMAQAGFDSVSEMIQELAAMHADGSMQSLIKAMARSQEAPTCNRVVQDPPEPEPPELEMLQPEPERQLRRHPSSSVTPTVLPEGCPSPPAISGARKHSDGAHSRKLHVVVQPPRDHSMAEPATTPVTDLFGEIDADGDGELDVGEARQLLGQELKLSHTESKVAFQQMDRDGSGAVDIEEFRGWWDTNVVDRRRKQLDARVQINGTGDFVRMQLSLAGTQLSVGDRRCAEVTGCTVQPPQSKRKGHPFAFKLNLSHPDSCGDSKYIIDPGTASLRAGWTLALRDSVSHFTVAPPECHSWVHPLSKCNLPLVHVLENCTDHVLRRIDCWNDSGAVMEGGEGGPPSQVAAKSSVSWGSHGVRGVMGITTGSSGYTHFRVQFHGEPKGRALDLYVCHSNPAVGKHRVGGAVQPPASTVAFVDDDDKLAEQQSMLERMLDTPDRSSLCDGLRLTWQNKTKDTTDGPTAGFQIIRHTLHVVSPAAVEMEALESTSPTESSDDSDTSLDEQDQEGPDEGDESDGDTHALSTGRMSVRVILLHARNIPKVDKFSETDAVVSLSFGASDRHMQSTAPKIDAGPEFSWSPEDLLKVSEAYVGRHGAKSAVGAELCFDNLPPRAARRLRIGLFDDNGNQRETKIGRCEVLLENLKHHHGDFDCGGGFTGWTALHTVHLQLEPTLTTFRRGKERERKKKPSIQMVIQVWCPATESDPGPPAVQAMLAGTDLDAEGTAPAQKERERPTPLPLGLCDVYVHIVEGRGLAPRDRNHTSDARVHARLCGQDRSTSVKHDAVNPWWDEQLSFSVQVEAANQLEGTHLTLTCVDVDIDQDDVVGEYELDLQFVWRLPGQELYRQWVALVNPEQCVEGISGYLLVDVAVCPEGSLPRPWTVWRASPNLSGISGLAEANWGPAATSPNDAALIPPSVNMEVKQLHFDCLYAEHVLDHRMKHYHSGEAAVDSSRHLTQADATESRQELETAHLYVKLILGNKCVQTKPAAFEKRIDPNDPAHVIWDLTWLANLGLPVMIPTAKEQKSSYPTVVVMLFQKRLLGHDEVLGVGKVALFDCIGLPPRKWHGPTWCFLYSAQDIGSAKQDNSIWIGLSNLLDGLSGGEEECLDTLQYCGRILIRFQISTPDIQGARVSLRRSDCNIKPASQSYECIPAVSLTVMSHAHKARPHAVWLQMDHGRGRTSNVDILCAIDICQTHAPKADVCLSRHSSAASTSSTPPPAARFTIAMFLIEVEGLPRGTTAVDQWVRITLCCGQVETHTQQLSLANKDGCCALDQILELDVDAPLLPRHGDDGDQPQTFQLPDIFVHVTVGASLEAHGSTYSWLRIPFKPVREEIVADSKKLSSTTHIQKHKTQQQKRRSPLFWVEKDLLTKSGETDKCYFYMTTVEKGCRHSESQSVLDLAAAATQHLLHVNCMEATGLQDGGGYYALFTLQTAPDTGAKPPTAAEVQLLAKTVHKWQSESAAKKTLEPNLPWTIDRDQKTARLSKSLSKNKLPRMPERAVQLVPLEPICTTAQEPEVNKQQETCTYWHEVLRLESPPKDISSKLLVDVFRRKWHAQDIHVGRAQGKDGLVLHQGATGPRRGWSVDSKPLTSGLHMNKFLVPLVDSTKKARVTFPNISLQFRQHALVSRAAWGYETQSHTLRVHVFRGMQLANDQDSGAEQILKVSVGRINGHLERQPGQPLGAIGTHADSSSSPRWFQTLVLQNLQLPGKTLRRAGCAPKVKVEIFDRKRLTGRVVIPMEQAYVISKQVARLNTSTTANKIDFSQCPRHWFQLRDDTDSPVGYVMLSFHLLRTSAQQSTDSTIFSFAGSAMRQFRVECLPVGCRGLRIRERHASVMLRVKVDKSERKLTAQRNIPSLLDPSFTMDGVIKVTTRLSFDPELHVDVCILDSSKSSRDGLSAVKTIGTAAIDLTPFLPRSHGLVQAAQQRRSCADCRKLGCCCDVVDALTHSSQGGVGWRSGTTVMPLSRSTSERIRHRWIEEESWCAL